MNILFVTTISTAEKTGGAIYSRSIISALNKIGAVEILTLSDHQRFRSRMLRLALSLTRSIFINTPPNVLLHSGNLDASAQMMLRKKWDIVIIDHLESAYACTALKIPFIYISHNIESNLIKSKIGRYPRWVQSLLGGWINKYEKKVANLASGVITISSEDAEWYQKTNSRVIVIPPTFEPRTIPIYQSDGVELKIGFLGSAKWKPNKDAVASLIRGILPNIHRPLELIIGGGGWSREELDFLCAKTGVGPHVKIKLLGYIDDIADFWSVIDLFVAPITTGAGVNVKVCEALAYGCPIVAFPYALRGLLGVPLDSVCVANDNIQFSRSINNFNKHRQQYQHPEILKPDYAKAILSQHINAVVNPNTKE